jgi:hypothetical protein
LRLLKCIAAQSSKESRLSNAGVATNDHFDLGGGHQHCQTVIDSKSSGKFRYRSTVGAEPIGQESFSVYERKVAAGGRLPDAHGFSSFEKMSRWSPRN